MAHIWLTDGLYMAYLFIATGCKAKCSTETIGQKVIRVFHLRNVPGEKTNIAKVNFTDVV